MKRLLSLMILLCLLAALIPAAHGEPAGDVLCYDFDFRLMLHPEVFPLHEQRRVRGYAALFDDLSFRGSFIYVPSTRSLDLSVSVVPNSNPSAAVSCRISGVPSHLMLTSPLLGDQTLFFNNIALMDFAYKTYQNLDIPLQYPVLLFPYATEYAFSSLVEAWRNYEQELLVSGDAVNALAYRFAQIADYDQPLYSWITALTADQPCADTVYNEFHALPAYLRNTVCLSAPLRMSAADGIRTWSNVRGDVLYTASDDPGEGQCWALTLPATDAGYLPFLCYSMNRDEHTLRFSLKGSYSREEKNGASLPEAAEAEDDWSDLYENEYGIDDDGEYDSEYVGDDEYAGGEKADAASSPDMLAALSVSGEGLPLSWPMSCNFGLSVRVDGAFLPAVSLDLQGRGTADGQLSLTAKLPLREDSDPVDVLEIIGSLTPAEPSWIPSFDIASILQHINIFSISDETLNVFLHQIARPCFLGVLSFIDAMPAKACQSIMDDLTDMGILDMILSV